MTKHHRQQLSALVLVLASAVVRLPVEQAITADFHRAELLPVALDTNLRSRMTQESFVAAAGGLRSLVASYYEVDAFSHFYENPPRWDLIDKNYALCCQLQPRVWHYWDMHSWMLASNAAEFYGSEGGAVKGLEEDLRKFYRRQGMKVAYEGIKHNPETYRSYAHAAQLLSFPNHKANPEPDQEQAAALYLKASECADANVPPLYFRRFLYRAHLFCLSKVPGHTRYVYAHLRRLFLSGPKEDLPTTRTILRQCEEELSVPIMLRAIFPVLPHHLPPLNFK